MHGQSERFGLLARNRREAGPTKERTQHGFQYTGNENKGQTTMSNETIINATENSNATDANVDDRSAQYKAGIKAIVGLIREKYEDEATRSFRIGKEGLDLAIWQLHNTPNYEGSDFDTLCRNIQADVRLYVAINPKSIRVSDWIKAYAFRETVRTDIGDAVADNISLFEYLRMLGQAYTFNKKTVEGSIAKGWHGFVRTLGYDRSTGKRVTSEAFLERLDKHVKQLEQDAKPKDKAKADALSVAQNILKKDADVKKANTAITTSVVDAVKAGHLDIANIVGIVETVAKEFGKDMPSNFGFNPAECTVDDCNTLALAMYQAGKLYEMKRLADRLEKFIGKMEETRKASEPTIPLPVESDAAKRAKEQVKAESKRNRVAANA
jgi:hypothetical protein